MVRKNVIFTRDDQDEGFRAESSYSSHKITDNSGVDLWNEILLLKTLDVINIWLYIP